MKIQIGAGNQMSVVRSVFWQATLENTKSKIVFLTQNVTMALAVNLEFSSGWSS
jgi:hypothetical protein